MLRFPRSPSTRRLSSNASDRGSSGQPPPPARSASRSARRRLALAGGLLAGLVGAIACSGSSSSTVQPTTGILVRAETLTTGRGCGTSPSNLFKYAVVVFGYDSGDPLAATSYTRPIAGNVFDCFADGTFIDLAPVGGNSRYRLEVYAYNEPAFTAARAAIEAAGTDRAALRERTSPTWTTECTATQQQDVQALALCAPLAPGLTGVGGTTGPTRITLRTARFTLPDGRTASCRTAGDGGISDAGDAEAPDADVSEPAEAGADAAVDGGGDAGDAGPGGGVWFTTARIRYRTATFVGPVTDLSCPTEYAADAPAEPARYDIDVGLLDGPSPVGQTTCTATTQTGTTSAATCP